MVFTSNGDLTFITPWSTIYSAPGTKEFMIANPECCPYGQCSKCLTHRNGFHPYNSPTKLALFFLYFRNEETEARNKNYLAKVTPWGYKYEPGFKPVSICILGGVTPKVRLDVHEVRWRYTREGERGKKQEEWAGKAPAQDASVIDICERREGRRYWVGKASDHWQSLKQANEWGVLGHSWKSPSSSMNGLLQ